MTITPEQIILQVERAASDIRRGMPVVIHYADGRKIAVASVEYQESGRIIKESENAAVLLMKISGMLPVAVTANANRADLLEVSEEALRSYRKALTHSLVKVSEARVPLKEAENARIIAFRPRFGHDEHLAILIGEPETVSSPLVRLHSSCITGDLLGSLRCDCGNQLQSALRQIAKEKNGLILYLNQEGRGIGIANKLRAYQLQDQGMDTVEANEALGFEADERDFAIAAQMLHQITIKSIMLLTNNPDKMKALAQHGIKVVERRPLVTEGNPYSQRYMDTKARRFGHYLDSKNEPF